MIVALFVLFMSLFLTFQEFIFLETSAGIGASRVQHEYLQTEKELQRELFQHWIEQPDSPSPVRKQAPSGIELERAILFLRAHESFPFFMHPVPVRTECTAGEISHEFLELLPHYPYLAPLISPDTCLDSHIPSSSTVVIAGNILETRPSAFPSVLQSLVIEGAAIWNDTLTVRSGTTLIAYGDIFLRQLESAGPLPVRIVSLTGSVIIEKITGEATIQSSAFLEHRAPQPLEPLSTSNEFFRELLLYGIGLPFNSPKSGER
ncbi:MAG: hypothetical protein KDD64_07310 [Bdellovibrionales bacterium]|nr:hypothetical protein [Bdellovibrionales bacterium]